ncbi:MAG: hypothetical protein AB7O80_01660 [Acetobacteraceae bacterium]
MNEFLQSIVETSFLLAIVVLFAILLGAGEIGYRMGRLRRASRALTEGERSNIGTLVAGMLTLVAFFLGITLSLAQSRFETRHDLVTSEANAIGTAWLRAGLFDGPDATAMVRLIEEYAKVRLAYLSAPQDSDLEAIRTRTSSLQNRIWAHGREIAIRTPTPISASLIASLNEMFDLSLSQRHAFASRVPIYLIWAILLGSIMGIGAMEYQFGVSGRRQTLLTVLMLLMWTGSVMLIVDLNRPRLGALRIDTRPLVWTIESFSPAPPSR